MINSLDIKELLKKDNRLISVDVYCLVYNHGRYLRESLDGILKQETDFPVRIIIHDDASTDDSSAIIREYEEKFPNKIVSVIEKENLYQNGKSILKVMLPYFTSKYIAFCEGDDYWTDSKKLQKQVDYLEDNQDCVAVYHNILPVDAKGKYCEGLRGIYEHLEEGDYTDSEIKMFALKTQTASLLIRNFYPWMSERDIDFHEKIKCNGDEKNFIICGLIGRVHYLSDVMAAHRKVLDCGDSWSATQSRLTESERVLVDNKRFIEKCKFYDYFSSQKVYRYNDIIFEQLRYLYKYRRFKLYMCNYIPVHAMVIFIPVFIYKCLRFIIRRLYHL